jgi:DNA-directed RNA polymerase specialized sigma24 family protein
MAKKPTGSDETEIRALEKRLEAYYLKYHRVLIRIFQYWRGKGQADPNIEAYINDCYTNLLITSGKGTELPDSEDGLHTYIMSMVWNRLRDQARSDRRHADFIASVTPPDSGHKRLTEADLDPAEAEADYKASIEADTGVTPPRKGNKVRGDFEQPGHLPEADETIRIKEAKAVIRDVLSRLEADLATTVVLLCVHDKKPPEIGKFFGVNGYVRVRWAKTKLFEALDEMEAAGETFAGDLAKQCNRPGETHQKKRQRRDAA